MVVTEVILILPKAFQTSISSKFNPNSSKLQTSTVFLFRYGNRARLLSSGVRQKWDNSATVANRATILQIYGYIDIHVKAGYTPLCLPSHEGKVQNYLWFSNISRFIQMFETKGVNGNNITQFVLCKMVYTCENKRNTKLFFWLNENRQEDALVNAGIPKSLIKIDLQRQLDDFKNNSLCLEIKTACTN